MQLAPVKKKLYYIKGKYMRSAFSMIMAIFVIVIMATVATLVTNLSSKSVKATTAQYQRAQAMLYAKSYTEFAILAVTAHDRTSNCVQTITGSIGTSPYGYDINTSIQYIGNNLGTCTTLGASTTLSTPLTIIVDVYVNYQDPDNTTAPALTVHRRTVQKI